MSTITAPALQTRSPPPPPTHANSGDASKQLKSDQAIAKTAAATAKQAAAKLAADQKAKATQQTITADQTAVTKDNTASQKAAARVTKDKNAIDVTT